MMNGAAQTVFVVDDDPSYLDGVTRVLRTAGFGVAGFRSAEEFVSELEPEARGCVVADLCMPGMDGMDLQETINRSQNPLPVVFLTGQGDVHASVRAMRNGAEDFILKTAPSTELLAAIQRALARDERERTKRLHQQSVVAAFAALSPRQMQVLTRVLAGLLNKQIAAELDITDRSVKRHRHSLMMKLGVGSVAELARLAVEGGLASADVEGEFSASPGALP